MKVLYVEDDPRDVELVCRELARLAPDIRVDVAASLSEARARLALPADALPLQSCRELPYDLVLVDLRLPDGTGLDLLGEIRTKDLPVAVVVLTGFGDEGAAVAALKAGADDYLAKREGYPSRLPTALEAALERFRAEAARKARPLRVLYAEHNAADIDLTRRHLDRYARHIHLDVVHTGPEVLFRLLGPEQDAKGCPCDVVLLDYRLPGLNALETVKKIREELRLDVPVVLVTGQGDEEVAAQALRLGVSDYVVKQSGYLFQLPASLESAFHRFELAREQEELRKSEEKYRSIFENIQDVYYETALDGTILEVSPSIEALSGGQVRREEVIGKSMNDFYADPRARQEFVSVLQERGFLRDYEVVLSQPDGSLVPCSLSCRLVRDTSGQPVKIIGMLRDIGERKRAEEDLRRSEEKFAKTFRASPDWASLTTLSDGRLLEVNDAFVKVTGYSREEVVGRTSEEIGLWADPSLRQKVAEDLGQKRSMRNVELQMRTRTGEVRSLLFSLELISIQGQECVLALGRDITEMKSLEEQLRLSQKMEAVARLAGGLAHDLNNLMTVVTGYADLLLSRMQEGDPLRREVGEIRAAGHRAANLVAQLMAVSRKQILKPVVHSLNDILENMQGMLGRLIGEDIEVRVHLGSNLWMIHADPSQMEQVILNLAVNARDAMPEGGKLSVETANVVLDKSYAERHAGVQPGEYVMLAVSDTGVGMDEETRVRIFEPFFTTKEKGKGTGLGLAVVYGIVKQSGGDIWVYSEPGRGTTFKVYFPRVEAAADKAKVSGKAVVVPKGHETILVVEDEPTVLSLIKQVLEGQGYRILGASGGEEALATLRSSGEPVSLLLTDVVMPGLSGKELATRLKEWNPRIKIVYMSGYAGEAIVHHGILDPGVHFLQKPFSPSDLARKIREALDAPL